MSAPPPMSGEAPRPLFDLVMAFVGELRATGIPISPAQTVVAWQALLHVPLDERSRLRSALGATLITTPAHLVVFDAVFEVYFGTDAGLLTPGTAGTGGHLATVSDDELRVVLTEALEAGDRVTLSLVAEEAVTRHADVRQGRASGVDFYAFKALRPMDVDGILRGLIQGQASRSRSRVAMFVEQELWETSAQQLQQEVEAVVRRRLVKDRGAEAVAATLRRPLPEDVDFIRASTAQLGEMGHAVAGLGRRAELALARRRPRSRGGRLDFRRTFRRALSSGGSPLQPQFHPAPRRRPELVVLTDVSGSVSSFASFTMQLLLGFTDQFAKVRAFAFIDGVAEVTEYFAEADDVSQVIAALNEDPQITWMDGHSDYGNALALFWERWGNALSPSSIVLVLGDARNNYHASGERFLDQLQRRTAAVYWLNPEPLDRWDTGDSMISEYARYCDRVVECRTLGDLETFVESLDG